MEFQSQFLLKPGPSATRPITLVIRNPQADEDGSRTTVEIDLSLEEAEKLSTDLMMVHRWVRLGAWKTGGQ